MMKQFIKKVLFFLISLIALSYVISWIYEIPRREAIQNGTHDTQLKWQDIHNTENAYDIIIVGSSRGDSAYNPAIIDSIASTQSYNLCSGSQNIVESYYILKEVLQYQQPKYIVFDTFLPSFSDNPDFYHVLSNGEFMSTSGQWDMIVNGFGIQGLANYTLPILKYKSYIKRDLTQLFSGPDKTHIRAKRIQGFYYGEEIIDSTSVQVFGPLSTIKNTHVSIDKTKKYLDLIAALCKNHNVQFLPVRAPYPPSRLANNPDPSHDYFTEVFTDLEVSFYDFNALPLDGLNDFDFSDDRHLNYKGAKKVSEALGDIIKEMEDDLQ